MTRTTAPATARRLLPDAPLLVAARGERPNHVPVWFMRQAGRSLPDYRQLRADVRLLIAELGQVPLIGFAGAPFTLASYLIEGGPSRHHERTKALMHSQPDVWHGLLDRLAELTLTFLRVQAAAGVDAVQLFDSWAGALSQRDYRHFVFPHSARVLAGVAGPGLPRIHFGVGTGDLLGAMAQAGADVVGVDWRVPPGR